MAARRRTVGLAGLVVAVALGALAGGCEPASIVSCAPGVFARVDGDAWCVYEPLAMVGCPDELPVEHDLPFGGIGCAEEEHDPVPEGLCEAAGRCASDAGSGG